MDIVWGSISPFPLDPNGKYVMLVEKRPDGQVRPMYDDFLDAKKRCEEREAENF